MELIEIIRWISIVLMWGATVLNVFALIKCVRTQKKIDELEELYKGAIQRYESARKAYEDRLKMVLGDVSDEGSDND